MIHVGLMSFSISQWKTTWSQPGMQKENKNQPNTLKRRQINDSLLESTESTLWVAHLFINNLGTDGKGRLADFMQSRN